MRVLEFFESDTGPLSMSRLLMFGSFVVTSALMFQIEMNEGYFAMYLGAFTGTYLTGKAIDSKSTPKGPEVKQ